MARALAERGYDILLLGRDAARLAAACDEIKGAHGRDAEALICDLSDEEAAAIRSVRELFDAEAAEAAGATKAWSDAARRAR